MILTPGPINKDYVEGELRNWHLEALNNTDCDVLVVLSVYSLYGLYPEPVPIGTTSVDLKPGQYTYMNLLIDAQYEHTIPTIEIPNDDVLITLYGRNASYQELSGAVYPRNLLVKLHRPIYQTNMVEESEV